MCFAESAPLMQNDDSDESAPEESVDRGDHADRMAPLLADSSAPLQNSLVQNWVIAMSAATAYALSYFWRYPVFMLPAEILGVNVVTLWGR